MTFKVLLWVLRN